MASQRGHDACVQVLVSAGAFIDLPNLRGTTPLMAAAMNGHAGVVKLLLVGKANLTITQVSAAAASSSEQQQSSSRAAAAQQQRSSCRSAISSSAIAAAQ